MNECDHCYHSPDDGREYGILTMYPPKYPVVCCKCKGINYISGRNGCNKNNPAYDNKAFYEEARPYRKENWKTNG